MPNVGRRLPPARRRLIEYEPNGSRIDVRQRTPAFESRKIERLHPCVTAYASAQLVAFGSSSAPPAWSRAAWTIRLRPARPAQRRARPVAPAKRPVLPVAHHRRRAGLAPAPVWAARSERAREGEAEPERAPGARASAPEERREPAEKV